MDVECGLYVVISTYKPTNRTPIVFLRLPLVKNKKHTNEENASTQSANPTEKTPGRSQRFLSLFASPYYIRFVACCVLCENASPSAHYGSRGNAQCPLISS